MKLLINLLGLIVSVFGVCFADKIIGQEKEQNKLYICLGLALQSITLSTTALFFGFTMHEFGILGLFA